MNNIAPSAQVTRKKILSAAAEQFSLFGPNKTSMEEIATEAGLSRATLYLHFSGKRALYEALLQSTMEGFIEEVVNLVSTDRPAPRKLRLFVELTARTYANNPVFLAALSADKDFSIQKVAAPIVKKYREAILEPMRSILKDGIKESSIRKLDVEGTAYLMYELGTELLIKELTGKADYPLNQILDVMDDLVANGILKN